MSSAASDPSSTQHDIASAAPVVAQPAGTAPVDQEAVARLEQRLDQLEQLGDLLGDDDQWAPPVLDYELPAGFKLSIVVPVFNEESTILHVLARLSRLPVPKEIIVVDDCSTDHTRMLLKSLAANDQLQILFKQRNEGKGAALRDGFDVARGDVVVVQDADLEYNPNDILHVLRPIVRGDADVVYGSRFLEHADQDPSRLHRFGNWLLTATSNLCTGLPLTDMETCYKAFRRCVLRGLPIKQNRFGFEPEITAKIARRRYRLKEVPVSYHARGYEEGKKIGVRDALNAFYCIVRYALAD